MPLYYFDIIDDGMMSRDEFGLDLASFEEARAQAQVLLPDIARSTLPDGDQHAFVCEVREEGRGLIYQGTLTYKGTLMASPLVSRVNEENHEQGRARGGANADDI